ncbi:MAG: hypothetical protein INR68_18050, partial [Methylobacterium mesophilicum]|nr:hypothetical protein [Methylobacterium mesophilicum]
MSEFVRFDARFEYTDPETKQRTRYPAGWTGEVDPAVAEAARRVRALPPAAKSAADVTAAQKRVDDAEVALKAAKSEAD